MKIDIVVVYIPRYAKGHEKHFVPPITGIYLAALVPEHHTVRVIHQQVEPVDLETDADLVALSFFTGFAPEAYHLAKEFKKRGKKVIAGGPHVTFSPEESLEHFDSIVIGEAESVFPQLIQDAENNTLQRKYTGEHKELAGLPCPRYEFVKQNFFVTRVVQATRGCPFSCTFCSVSSLNPGYRTRPVKDVIRDISYNDFRHWWQRKIVWFWDDNLTAHRPYIKELLQSMIPLRKWWLTQASMDIARDEELLDLLQKSGCIGIFFGIESFQSDSLKDAGKTQNKREEYKKQIQALHSKGICVMGGFISGFDSDTPESIQAMAKELYDIGVDVPFLSVLTPYKGTDIYDKLLSEGRIREPKGWEFYNGYNVSFVPQKMTTQELLSAHRTLWKKAFSIPFSMKRILRSLFALRTGAWLMCLFMNVFYGIKAFRENLPKSFEENNPYSQK